MKNTKLSIFFGKGRKIIFSLALFLLVFAAASVVKIHAGTSDSGSGWLWSGSDDGAGNNTGVGWISVNNANQGGSVSYGLSIPAGTGDISGYAWSENIGWISFNAADTAGCPQGSCKTEKIAGNNFKGWARILGIRDALAAGNSGGWQGWISLSGPHYGVKINADNTLTGFGWSDELGWIDFSRAEYTPVYSIASVDPATPPVYLREPSNKCQPITVTLENVSGNKTVNFAVNPTGVVKISKNSDCSSSSDGFSLTISDNNPHKIYVSSTSYSALANASVKISGDCVTSTEAVQVIKTPSCILNCPSEVIISSGKTKSVKPEIFVTGDSECASLVACSESGTDSKGNISVSRDCDVSEVGNLRYGSSELTASAGSDFCTASINVKGPGWVEANP